ncbi:MAG TPA: glycosyltransferase, partial [Actinomycetota bacterium]|nr:glycosyltransferase [Actinomycetota bacterium]
TEGGVVSRRVAMISEHASPLGALGGVDGGGQNVYVGELAKALVALGYEVDVFTRRDGDMLPQTAEWMSGVRIVHVPAGPPRRVPKEELLEHMGEFTAFMVRFCRRNHYDLVHANFFMSGLVAAALKERLGLPFVVTFHALGRVRRFHQGGADRFPDERFAIEDRVVREADHIIAECPQEEEDLLGFYNADPARITIVPAGFDPNEFWPLGKELARVALGLEPRERVVLQVGRLVPRKGVETAIEGFAKLVHHHGVRARLLVVGGESEVPDESATPELGRLRRRAQREGVADLVSFVGRRGRDALKWYYSAADIFVSTPWYEPFGITPIEAMACGTPVIGSNVGGVKFSVRDGETGYLVPPRDPDALAERLAHLFERPKLRGAFARQAVRRAQDLFTWARVARSVAAVYEDVVTTRHPEGREEARRLAAVERCLDEAVEALEGSRRLLRGALLDAAAVVVRAMESGGKVLTCGNGGSATDAQHVAAELVGRFKIGDRAALPALALTADSAVLTAWANDRGFDAVFERQVEALGRRGDVLLGISTSGRSRNLVRAFESARRAGIACVALLGGDGGRVRELSDVAIVVPSSDPQRIQEVHTVLLHVLCELVEEGMAEAREGAAEAAPAPAGVIVAPQRRWGAVSLVEVEDVSSTARGSEDK